MPTGGSGSVWAGLCASSASLAWPLSFDGLPAASFAHAVEGRPVWWNADAAAGTASAANTATSEISFLMSPPFVGSP